MESNSMEENLIRKAEMRGIKASLFSVTLNEEENFAFAQRAFAVVKDFASLNPSQHARLGLAEYTVDNIERLFKARGKSADAEFSRFVSLFASYRLSGEIELYREMYQFNINIKTAQIFVRFFLMVGDLHTHFYSNKSRLLQHIKLDTLRAKEMAAGLLVKEMRVSIFNNLVLKYMEEHNQEIHKMRADVTARFLIQAYFYNNIRVEEGEDAQDVLLNWNSRTPNVFEIKVKKQPNAGSDDEANGHATEDPDASPAPAQDESPVLEQINADFQKKNRPAAKVGGNEADHATASSKAPTMGFATNGTAYATNGDHGDKSKLKAICYDYVLGKNASYKHAEPRAAANEEYSEAADLRLNGELERLRKELNQRKNEAEIEKSVWKLVLNNSKAAIRNYTELKKEIMITEGLAEALFNIAEKGTPEWKALYDIRSHDVGVLYRYKFLIAALLENCLQDLDSDIQGFKFGHDEPSHKMNKVLNKEGHFDLNDYLTNVFQTNKLFASSGSNNDLPPRLDGYAKDKSMHASADDLAEPVIQQFKFPGKPATRDNSLDKSPRADGGHDHDQGQAMDPEEQKRKEEEEIREAIENQEVAKLKKHLLKLKRELVYAPKKPPKEEEKPEEVPPPEEIPEPEPAPPTPTKAKSGKDKPKAGVAGHGFKTVGGKPAKVAKVEAKPGVKKPAVSKF